MSAEAQRIVSLCKGLGVVGAAGQVGDVDACESVGFAGVAADGQELGVLERGGQEVR